jgi:thiol:disulfide interchange protein DsbD
MKRVVSFFAVVLFFLHFSANAQIEEHAHWTFSSEKGSNGEVTLIFDVDIDEGWHLYSPYNPPGGSLPLTIEYNDNSGFEKIGNIIEIPKPTVVYDDIFMKDEYFFEHHATFKQKIKVLSSKDFKITGTIEGQTCLADGRCVSFSKDFSFDIKGVKQQNSNNTQVTDNQQIVSDDGTSSDINEDNEVNVDTPAIDTSSDAKTVLLDSNSKDTSVQKISYEPTGYTPILVNNNEYESSGKKRSLLGFFLISFLLGLAALLTPCVFPMVPMTISFFIKGKDSKRGKLNASLYGLSIVAIYTLPIAIIIIIAQLFGAGDSISGDFANFLSTHWLPNILFFLIFMIFAASFFGAFEITLPHKFVNKMSSKSGQGGFLGIFFMAFTLVLVSFSCTGPIVGAVLVESTQGGLIIKPLIGMLGFSMGVALPFTLFAFFPSILQDLPKSGGWLNSVKVVLGFIELALGLKFLSIVDLTYHWHLLNREIYLALWIVIFAMMGFYLLGKMKFAHDSDIKHISIFRLAMAILTFSFVVYMVPGMFGAPLKELSGYLPPKHTQAFDIERYTQGNTSANLCEKPLYADQLELPHGLQGYFDVYQALNCAKELKKPIFIDFTGHGCVNCRKMEEYVWADPRVLRILSEDFVIVSLYVDDKSIEVPESRWFESLADGKMKTSLGKQNADIEIYNFKKNAQPLYVLIDYEGNMLAVPHEYNPDVDEFVKFLEEGKKQFKILHPIK